MLRVGRTGSGVWTCSSADPIIAPPLVPTEFAKAVHLEIGPGRGSGGLGARRLSERLYSSFWN